MGTNTQTAEPRVQVSLQKTPPCGGLPDGFYAARIQHQDKTPGYAVITIDAAKIPNLIADLQAAQIELAAQALTDKAGVTAAKPDDSALLNELVTEELVTLSAPAFSGVITKTIAAAGNYRRIWEVLNDAHDPMWDKLTDKELRAIIADYRHTLPDGSWVRMLALDDASRTNLIDAAMAIFVGRAAEIEAASEDISAAFIAAKKPVTYQQAMEAATFISGDVVDGKLVIAMKIDNTVDFGEAVKALERGYEPQNPAAGGDA